MDIPAGTLATALTKFALKTNIQLVFINKDVGSLSTNGLHGTFTSSEALDILLRPTHLTYRRVNSRTIAIVFREASRQGKQGHEKSQLPKPTPIEDIIVTALKRNSRLQDVPASISAFDNRILDAFHIDTIQDVSRLTPNFLGAAFTNTIPILSIRGGSNTVGAIGTSKPIGIYVDEVYMPRFSLADVDFFDLRGVEILRGPQGTLFGRNVAAGAIAITTAKPTLDGRTAKVQASYGNYNAYSLRGLINLPLSDTLATRVSISRTRHDGYGMDTLTGTREDDQKRFATRAALLWCPTDRLKAVLSIDYAKDNNNSRTLSAVGYGDSDRRTSQVGIPQHFSREIYGGSLHLTYHTDSGDVISITGLRASDSNEYYSWVGLSYSLLPFGFQQVADDRETPRTLSQEVRFVSDDIGPVNFIAGLYYLHENSGRLFHQVRLAAQSGNTVGDLIFDQKIRTNSVAGFFDGTLHLSDHLDLSAGGRYTFENRRASLHFVDNLDGTKSFEANDLSADFGLFTPRLALTYRPNSNMTLFFNMTTGFTAGGFYTEADTLTEVKTPFKAETVLSFEAGFKSSFADRRGYANGSLFRQKYSDKQEFVLDPQTLFGSVLNAADATVKGLELEVGWRFNEFLHIDASYGLLDTRYDRFPIGSDSTGYSGNQLGNAPHHQFAITGNSNYPVFGGAAEVFANAGWEWTGGYYTGASNDPNLFVNGYGLLNASLGLHSMDQRWSVELYGTNLLNKDFVLIPSTFIIPAEHLGPPRFYGLRLTLSF